MTSRARFLGHAMHPMLVTIPLGVLSTAIVFDVIHLVDGEPRWADVSFWMITAGIIGGVVAAIPGLIDWLAIPRGTRARRIGLLHGLGNLVVLGAFVASWLMRRADPGHPPTEAVIVAIAGFALAGVTAWLGGELIERLGVAVHEGANVDAPSSLTTDGSFAVRRTTLHESR
jgi:uncharacterized membrane protein